MPCSGLNRATSLTPSALASRSIVARAVAVAAGVVGDQPDLRPFSGAKFSVSEDVDAAVRPDADRRTWLSLAVRVARADRRRDERGDLGRGGGSTFPLPSGWTRLVRR